MILKISNEILIDVINNFILYRYVLIIIFIKLRRKKVKMKILKWHTMYSFIALHKSHDCRRIKVNLIFSNGTTYFSFCNWYTFFFNRKYSSINI